MISLLRFILTAAGQSLLCSFIAWAKPSVLPISLILFSRCACDDYRKEIRIRPKGGSVDVEKNGNFKHW